MHIIAATEEALKAPQFVALDYVFIRRSSWGTQRCWKLLRNGGNITNVDMEYGQPEVYARLSIFDIQATDWEVLEKDPTADDES